MGDFATMWSELQDVGRAPSGGYRRFTFATAELECREWFAAQAGHRGLEVETDRNGNVWAWWHPEAASDESALVVGSHLDSVPDGGAFDGPLGIVAAFASIDSLRLDGFIPRRPLAIAAFAEEEGARFGIACAGSRLLTGQLDGDRARGLTDSDGITLAEAARRSGIDPEGMGADPERLKRIGQFVELHIEQGRCLADSGHPIAIAESIWPHGRYRFTFDGESNHAGTTRMEHRRDPMTPCARMIVAAETAGRQANARATIGRLKVEPNGTNAIPSRVTAWLDARAATESDLDALLEQIKFGAAQGAAASAVHVNFEAESVTGLTTFDPLLTERMGSALTVAGLSRGVPVIPTGAGHDAGVLATAGIPSGMLFVRNPSGVSHSPDEFAEAEDCLAGVEALAAVIRELA